MQCITDIRFWMDTIYLQPHLDSIFIISPACSAMRACQNLWCHFRRRSLFPEWDIVQSLADSEKLVHAVVSSGLLLQHTLCRTNKADITSDRELILKYSLLYLNVWTDWLLLMSLTCSPAITVSTKPCLCSTSFDSGLIVLLLWLCPFLKIISLTIPYNPVCLYHLSCSLCW